MLCSHTVTTRNQSLLTDCRAPGDDTQYNNTHTYVEPNSETATLLAAAAQLWLVLPALLRFVVLMPTARLSALDSQLPVLLPLALLLLLQSSLQMLLAVLGAAVLGALLLALLRYTSASRTALRPLTGARDAVAGKDARASSGWYGS
jgi:hypothetical protein